MMKKVKITDKREVRPRQVRKRAPNKDTIIKGLETNNAVIIRALRTAHAALRKMVDEDFSGEILSHEERVAYVRLSKECEAALDVVEAVLL